MKQMRSMVFLFCGFALLACTERNKASDSSAQIRLSLPNSLQSTASSAPTITRIMLNITGPGIDTPLVWICDQHENGTCPQSGGSVSMMVPRGSARLVQVLVVIE